MGAARSLRHRNERRDLFCLTGSSVLEQLLETVARRTEAKASNQVSCLPSERPRIFPDVSEKVPLSRRKSTYQLLTVLLLLYCV